MPLDSLMIPLLIALVAVPMFLQARKQKRAMREQQQLQNSLVAGDRVMTTSGLYGTVVTAGDDTIDLEIAPGVTTTWLRAAVREKVEAEASDATATEDEAADTDEVAEKHETAEKSEATATESSAQVAEPIEQQKAN
jgi:preprotein translocase subunit YajC